MPCLNAAARLAGPSDALDPKTARVGCIGLGAMGSKMCSNLASRCGQRLLAHDAYAPLVDAAVAAGCGAARSLADFAEVELLVVLSLPRSSDVQSVVDALVEAHGLRAGCIVVDTTSGIPAVSKAIAERLSSIGVDYLDFGVAGGPSGAAAARLSGMVGGSEAALRRAMPIVALFCDADAVHHMGPPGSGHAVKAVNNMLLAANIATATEALTLLRKAGVSSEAALAAINSSSGRSLVTEERIPKHVLSGNFDFGFRLDLMMKARARRSPASCTPPPSGPLTAHLLLTPLSPFTSPSLPLRTCATPST